MQLSCPQPTGPRDCRGQTPIPTSRWAQLAPKGSKTGQGRGRWAGGREGGGRLFPTTPPPPRDLRGLDSRSSGQNVPGAPGSRKSGEGLSLTPDTPTTECSRPKLLPSEPVLPSSPPPASPKNETSFQRPLSLQRPAPVIPGKCPFRTTLRVSSCPPAPLKFPSTTSPNNPEAPGPSGAHRGPQAWEPSGRRGGAAPPFTPFTCFSG